MQNLSSPVIGYRNSAPLLPPYFQLHGPPPPAATIHLAHSTRKMSHLFPFAVNSTCALCRDRCVSAVAHIYMSVLRHRYFLRVAAVILLCLTLVQLYPSRNSLAIFLESSKSPYDAHNVINKGKFNGTWDFRRDEKNYRLDDAECQHAFPGLFEEVDRAVQDRRNNSITFEELESIPRINGYVRGMIYEQEVGSPIFSPHQQIMSQQAHHQIKWQSFIRRTPIMSQQQKRF